MINEQAKYQVAGLVDSTPVLHIECLPGGFLVSASGGVRYHRQVCPTREDLILFVTKWTIPEP